MTQRQQPFLSTSSPRYVLFPRIFHAGSVLSLAPPPRVPPSTARDYFPLARTLDDPDDFCVDITTYPGTVSILFSLAKQRKLQMKEVRNLGECADKWDCSVNSPKKFKPATDSRCEGFPTAADYIAKVAFSGITACHELPPNAKEAKPGMPMEMLPPSSLKEALESMAERDSSTWPRCSDVLSVAMQYNRQHAGGISGGGQPATEAGGGGEAEPVPVRNGFLQHAMDHVPFGLGFSSEMHGDWEEK